MNRYAAMGLGIVLTSILLVFALPLGEQGYLAPIALVPLLVSTRRQGFIWGFAAAIITLFLCGFIASQGWLYREKWPYPPGTAMVYAACGIFGFAVSLTTAFAADVKVGEKPVWALAGLATLFEAALLIELPGHLALTQYRNSGMLAIASVGGVWVVSFLLYWMNLTISRLEFRQMWVGLGLVGVVLVGGLLPPSTASEGMMVAALQVDINNSERVEEWHRQAVEKEIPLAVWPEFAGISFVGRDTKKLLDLSQTTAIITSFPDDNRPKPYNVASVFYKGTESERYRKRKLFGGEKKDHTPGNKALSVPFDKHRVGLGICFDSCFPMSMRQTARGADLIALPTADPLSPHGFLAAMHAAYTPFRAAETGAPIIRTDSDAYSMVVDSAGTIIAEAGIGDAMIVTKMPFRFRNPLAAFLGDFMLVVAGFLVVYGFWPKRKSAMDLDR